MATERKTQITKPLNDALTSARDLFKPIEQNCAAAETIIKNKMLAYDAAQEKARELAAAKITARVEKGTLKEETAADKLAALPQVQTTSVGKVGTASSRTVTKYRVTDKSLLPNEYLVPDMGAITEAIKRGVVVPGAESYTEKIISAR